MDEERLKALEGWAGYPDRDPQAARLVRELVREVRRLNASRLRLNKDARQAFIDCLEIVDALADVAKNSDKGDKDLPAKWFATALNTAGDAIASAAKRRLADKLLSDELLAVFERIGWKQREKAAAVPPFRGILNGITAADVYGVEV